jgi:hypothetical protein
MKYNLAHPAALLAGALAAASACAQSTGQGVSLLQDSTGDEWPLNRVGLSYRPAFNITARFRNVGPFAGFSNPGPATSGVNHNYDDGYNRVDSTQNAGGMTSYWGYQNASQLPGNNTIVMTSTAPNLGAASPSVGSDPQEGFELSYQRELGHQQRFHWGLEGAFGFTDLIIHDTQTLTGGFTRTSDSYSLLGITPPTLLPYNGPQTAVPGAPVIGDTPTRTVTQAAATGYRNLDADIFSFRLGPYLELPVAKRLAVSLSGGLALVYVNSTFQFQESALPAIQGQPLYTGSGSHSSLLPGGYAAASISYAVSHAVDLSAGVQYMNLGRYSQIENGKQAQVDFSNSLFLTLGVGYRF